MPPDTAVPQNLMRYTAMGVLLFQRSLDHPSPDPFSDVFLACTKDCPKNRPPVAQVKAMLEPV